MIEQNKIPENSTKIKENSTWHKVDLSKTKVKHQPKPKWLRVKLPIGDKYTQLRNLVYKYLFSFSVPICRNTCIIYIRPSRG